MKKFSKFLSYLLRHSDIDMDSDGWVNISTIMMEMKSKFSDFTRKDLFSIVENDEKTRYKIDLHKNKIRANQGHSINVKLDLEKKVPPKILYHGTKVDNLDSIFKTGINKGKRTHVHLSEDIPTATIVANRRSGKSVILEVNTEICDTIFYLSDNGVWLCDSVTPKAIRIL